MPFSGPAPPLPQLKQDFIPLPAASPKRWNTRFRPIRHLTDSKTMNSDTSAASLSAAEGTNDGAVAVDIDKGRVMLPKANATPSPDIPPKKTTAEVEANELLEITRHTRTVVPLTARPDDASKSPFLVWLLYNFPRPQRRQLTRIFRALVIAWCSLAISFSYPQTFNFLLVAIFVILCRPVGTVAAQLLLLVVGGIVVAWGLCFDLLGQLWVVLYNTAHPEDANPYVLALIIETWIVFVVWVGSTVQYQNLGTPLALFGFAPLPLLTPLIMSAPVIDHTKTLGFVTLFDVFLLPWVLIFGIGAVSSILVFPEHDTENTRETCYNLLADLRVAFAGEANTAELDVFYTGRIRASLAALVTDTKGCLKDIAFLYDAPARMVRVSRAAQALARHTVANVHSEVIARALEAAMDALLVPRPFWAGGRYNSRLPAPSADSGKHDFTAIRDDLERRKAELCARPPGSFAEDDLITFVEYLALEDCQALIDEVKDMVNARQGWKFYFFGNPGKKLAALPKKPKTKTKKESPAAKRPATWHPGKFLADLLYNFQSLISSDATRFGFKRAFMYFIASVWAFLPGTALYYYENNVFWILITTTVLMMPTLGSGVTKGILRLGGTLGGVFWAYLAFLAAGGQGSTWFNFNRTSLLMVIPLSILGFYLEFATTRHTYAGFVLMLSFVIVVIPNPGHNPLALVQSFAAQRVLWVTVGVVACLTMQIVVFPFLASTDVRLTHAAVLGKIEGLIRRLHFGEQNEDSAATTDDLDGLLDVFRGIQQKLQLCREGTLIDSFDEPELDRPWDMTTVRAMSTCTQRVLWLTGLLVDRALHGESKPFRYMDDAMEQLIWKLHTLSATVVSKKPLPRLPVLALNKFTTGIIDGETGMTRMLDAGMIAAVSLLFEKVDVLEELIARWYGRESLPREQETQGSLQALLWGPELNVLNVERRALGPDSDETVE